MLNGDDYDYSNMSVSDAVRQAQERQRMIEKEVREQQWFEEPYEEERVPWAWALVIVAALATMFAGVLWTILWMIGIM